MSRIKAQSQIGWIHFSRDALRKVEARLKAEQEGVLDEIGFLLLHQAYADRFFPGTSVLQTRLRYIFFVPWMYQSLIKSFRGGNFERELIQKEIELTKHLLRHTKDGVIGSRSLPRPTSQPASMVYWTALGTWGFLRPLPDGHLPARSRIHRFLSGRKTAVRILDDDKEPLEEGWRTFASMPEPPEAWEKPETKLNFRLRKEEKDFLIKHLVGLPAGSGNGEMSLLARLVEKRVSVSKLGVPWEKPVLDAASDNDRAALIRAKQVAALAAIGRGVYASLVESALERDGLETDSLHRDALTDLLGEFGAEALKLDMTGICLDFPHLNGKGIMAVLKSTQAWIASNRRDPSALKGCYEKAEIARKGMVRAKLPNTPYARERRKEWGLNKGEKSGPLHYRWRNVRRLLMDLWGEA